MCRAIDEGGRRCPCQQPAARAAQRKAKRGADATSEPIGMGGAEVQHDAAPPDLLEVWQPERVRQMAQDIHDAIHTPRGRIIGRDDNPSEAEVDAAYDRHNEARRIVEELGGQEAAVRAVGDAVAREAERRAGVDVTTVQAQCADYVAREQAEVERLNGEVDRLNARIAQTPEGQAWDEAQKRFNDSNGGPGSDSYSREERAEIRQEYYRANSALNELEDVKTRREITGQVRQYERNITQAMPEEAKDSLRKLSDSYLEVLSETRDMGGVKTQWAAKTQKKAAVAFDEAAQMFPTQWIEKHNAGTPVLARLSTARAHYSNGTLKTERKRVRNQHLIMRDASDDPPKDTAYSTYRLATEEEAEKAHFTPGVETVYMKEGWETYRSWGGFREDEPPKGRGWEVYADPDDPDRKTWRRPSYSMRTVGMQVIPEITSNPDLSTVRRGGSHFSVASHELSHRFEAVMPEIGGLESDFLRRRTSDDDGERDEATALYGGRRHRGKKEMAREDDFVNAYIGKDYGSSVHHEVMSMGTQMLFSGDEGGLVGAGRYKADTDMRAFVLGVFVSAGRR